MNAAVVLPAATVTRLGTVTAELVLKRLTGNPSAGAAEFKVTVQVSEAGPTKEVFAQPIVLNWAMPVPLRPIDMVGF